jgi:hypothetical protein
MLFGALIFAAVTGQMASRLALDVKVILTPPCIFHH